MKCYHEIVMDVPECSLSASSAMEKQVKATRYSAPTVRHI
jgi:hypothetical protein